MTWMDLTTLSTNLATGVTSGIQGSIDLVEGFASPVTELIVFLWVTAAIVWIVFLVAKKIRG